MGMRLLRQLIEASKLSVADARSVVLDLQRDKMLNRLSARRLLAQLGDSPVRRKRPLKR